MPRGGKRPGAGRPRGSLGAMTERVLDLLEELDFDPLEELVTLYRDPATDRRTKVRIACELAQFVAPKLKAVDVQNAGNPGILINVIQFQAGREKMIVQVDAETPPAFYRLLGRSPIPEIEIPSAKVTFASETEGEF
jgi:hypothetical protein